MTKALITPIVLLALLVPAIYAVLINLQSSNIHQIGGTGQVSVVCPASGCEIDDVSWVLTSTPPYRVSGVNVTWTPASGTATYTVYVTVYDDSMTVIASGTATQSGSTSPVTTTVTLDNQLDPAQIYYVEIVIVEQ